MSTDSKPDQRQSFEGPFRTLTLLALPLLSFQRDILGATKRRVQDASRVQPAERFTFSELQALMMILDPARTFRNRLGPDFETKMEDAYKEIYPKFASASVELIDAVDLALSRMMEALNALRKDSKANNSSRRQD